MQILYCVPFDKNVSNILHILRFDNINKNNYLKVIKCYKWLDYRWPEVHNICWVITYVSVCGWDRKDLFWWCCTTHRAVVCCLLQSPAAAPCSCWAHIRRSAYSCPGTAGHKKDTHSHAHALHRLLHNTDRRPSNLIVLMLLFTNIMKNSQ